MKLDLASNTIYYSIYGEGPCVLLLHGFMENGSIWDPFIKDLSKQYKLIVVDLPGHGKSDDLKEDYSLDHIASLIKGLLDSLSISRVDIVGHSMGGYVGLALADLYPKIISSLCLFHSISASDNYETKNIRDKKIKILASHPTQFIEESIRNLFWKNNIDRFKKEIDQLADSAKRGSTAGYQHALLAMKNRPDRSQILKSGLSTYLIAGKYDPVIPLSKSLSEIESINHGKSYILQKSGHMGFIEEKEKSLDYLKEILSR